MLNNQKNLETYFELLKEDTYLNQCDLCIFNCKKENDMILHLSNWHDDCSSWDLCGKYFGTQQLLENHNKETHNKKDNMTESEFEDIIEKKSKKKKINSKKQKLIKSQH